MITRRDYINGECTHDEYYGQFINDDMKRFVLRHISKNRLIASSDEHFNDISLDVWDMIPTPNHVGKQLREAGDYLTVSGGVCLAKAAARMIVEGSKG